MRIVIIDDSDLDDASVLTLVDCRGSGERIIDIFDPVAALRSIDHSPISTDSLFGTGLDVVDQ